VDLPVGSLSSFVCSVLRGSSLEFYALISWLARRFKPVLSSSIVVNPQLFKDLSSTIALKDRGFVSVSSRVNDWTVEMYDGDGSVSSISWILLYRSSLSGYRAADFHQACDGMGKFVVVVKAVNGRIAAAYNADGFTSASSLTSSNLDGFIVSVAEDGGCGDIFNRNALKVGFYNFTDDGPVFNDNLYISNVCHMNERSSSRLGSSYGEGPGLNPLALFGQEWIRVDDYEVFKMVIE
jgi:hypothetical protein